MVSLQVDLAQQRSLSAIHQLEDKVPTTEKSFKALFDAYSDPVSYKQKFVDQNAFLVYYTKGFDGPGRAPIEDDLPVKQTQQYGARNDAWVAMEELLAEMEYVAKNPDDMDVDTLGKLLSKTIAAVDSYLALAPKQDVETALKGR